ncbi:MAG: glycosyltransferase family 39 protein [Dehalococcoidia bacterium]|nr:glycosyltransferase family 39 protein [Dehalococcoidia bacterium]
MKEHWPLLCLALISLAMHLSIADYPESCVCDECYYIPQAVSIIHERGPQVLEADPTFLDHPCLAKLLVAGGIAAFGDNPWGWRIPSIIFSVASVGIFYSICKNLAGRQTASFASLLLVFENFTFSWSGLAMLDVFSLTFMLSSFLLFLHKRYFLSGTALALAGLCKLPGLFGIIVILGYWAFDKKRTSVRNIAGLVFSLVVVFLLLMPVCDFAATSQWFNPADRISGMLTKAASLKYSDVPPEVRLESGMAYPWQWILSPGNWAESDGKKISLGFTPMFFPLILPSVIYMAYEAITKMRRWAVFGVLWFGATYVVWIPVALVTDRAMYPFYFLPTVGAICMGIGAGIRSLWQMSKKKDGRHVRWLLKGIVLSYLILYLLTFFAISTFGRGTAVVSSSPPPP